MQSPAFPMFVAAILFATPVVADQLPVPKASYSADVSFESKGKAFGGHIYVDGAKERREVTNASGVSTIAIIRRDQGRVYDLKPARKLAVAMRMAAAEAAGKTGAPGADVDSFYGVEGKIEGKEAIAGLDTTKYHFKIDGGPGLTVDAMVWSTDDGVVVRVVGNTSIENDTPPSRMELKNIMRGPQDASLFELPAGMEVLSAGGDSDVPAPALAPAAPEPAVATNPAPPAAPESPAPPAK